MRVFLLIFATILKKINFILHYLNFLNKILLEKEEEIKSLNEKLYSIQLNKQSKMNRITEIRNDMIINQDYILILKF